MKIWHKSANTDLGRIILRWRHRNTGRFYNKILSWILAAFIMGIFTSIVCATLGISDQAVTLSRIAFFITLVGGTFNSYFIYSVFGSEYRITEQAFVSVHPLIGFLPLAEKLAGPEKPLGARFEHLTWEEIKEAKEQDGGLLLILKNNLEEVQIGVSPVVFLANESTVKQTGKSTNTKDENLDRETLKAIVLKIREIKKSVKS
jgi:hypothetical protein